MNSYDDARRTGERLARQHAKGDPFATAITNTRMPMVITDPAQHDNPIVFANQAFLDLTGYAREEVIGRNCRLLQGPDTTPESAAAIRRAIETREPTFRGEILNYRKDGTSFWNALFMSPVVDEAGSVLYFFASQHDVTEQKARELSLRERRDELELEVRRRTAELQRTIDQLKETSQAKTLLLHEVDHRVKNNLQTMASLVRLQAKRADSPQTAAALGAVQARIEALSMVHRRLFQGDDVGTFDIAEFARELATESVNASGRTDIAVTFDLEPVAIPAAKAAPIALMINELLTNAVRHAFPERGGRIAVAVRRINGCFHIRIEDDGIGLPKDEVPGRRTLGRTIVQLLAGQLQAEPVWSDAEPGTRIELSLPIRFVEKE